METTLHRQLKDHFADAATGSVEFRSDGFRADAIGPDGEWVEIQSSPLGQLRPKLLRLLPLRRVRVVKPIVLERRIIVLGRSGGPEKPPRRSPYRGDLVEVFDDLVHLVQVFPDPHLRLDVLGVTIDEVRSPRRRRPGYAVEDRRLREIRRTIRVEQPRDLWELLPPRPEGRWADGFTTRDLDGWLGRGLAFAQRVAYCLRLAGAVEVSGVRDRHRVYRIADVEPTAPSPAATSRVRRPCRQARAALT